MQRFEAAPDPFTGNHEREKVDAGFSRGWQMKVVGAVNGLKGRLSRLSESAVLSESGSGVGLRRPSSGVFRKSFPKMLSECR